MAFEPLLSCPATAPDDCFYKRHKASFPRSAENSPLLPAKLLKRNGVYKFFWPKIQAGERFTGLKSTDLI
jgi:hypothetical protein